MQCRDFRREDWDVRPAPLREAQDMVREHHYSRGGSNTAVYVHGLYRREDGRLSGVAWWLPPTRVACESVDRARWRQVLALTRLVVLPDVPPNACTFLMARSVRLIRADARFVSLVTYADESQGHTGTIYKAGNWTYVGRTGPYGRWVDPATGRQVSVKATTSRSAARMRELGYVRDGYYHKHKFVMYLDGVPAEHRRPAALAV